MGTFASPVLVEDSLWMLVTRKRDRTANRSTGTLERATKLRSSRPFQNTVKRYFIRAPMNRLQRLHESRTHLRSSNETLLPESLENPRSQQDRTASAQEELSSIHVMKPNSSAKDSYTRTKIAGRRERQTLHENPIEKHVAVPNLRGYWANKVQKPQVQSVKANENQRSFSAASAKRDNLGLEVQLSLQKHTSEAFAMSCLETLQLVDKLGVYGQDINAIQTCMEAPLKGFTIKKASDEAASESLTQQKLQTCKAVSQPLLMNKVTSNQIVAETCSSSITNHVRIADTTKSDDPLRRKSESSSQTSSDMQPISTTQVSQVGTEKMDVVIGLLNIDTSKLQPLLLMRPRMQSAESNVMCMNGQTQLEISSPSFRRVPQVKSFGVEQPLEVQFGYVDQADTMIDDGQTVQFSSPLQMNKALKILAQEPNNVCHSAVSIDNLGVSSSVRLRGSHSTEVDFIRSESDVTGVVPCDVCSCVKQFTPQLDSQNNTQFYESDSAKELTVNQTRETKGNAHENQASDATARPADDTLSGMDPQTDKVSIYNDEKVSAHVDSRALKTLSSDMVQTLSACCTESAHQGISLSETLSCLSQHDLLSREKCPPLSDVGRLPYLRSCQFAISRNCDPKSEENFHGTSTLFNYQTEALAPEKQETEALSLNDEAIILNDRASLQQRYLSLPNENVGTDISQPTMSKCNKDSTEKNNELLNNCKPLSRNATHNDVSVATIRARIEEVMQRLRSQNEDVICPPNLPNVARKPEVGSVPCPIIPSTDKKDSSGRAIGESMGKMSVAHNDQVSSTKFIPLSTPTTLKSSPQILSVSGPTWPYRQNIVAPYSTIPASSGIVTSPSYHQDAYCNLTAPTGSTKYSAPLSVPYQIRHDCTINFKDKLPCNTQRHGFHQSLNFQGLQVSDYGKSRQRRCERGILPTPGSSQIRNTINAFPGRDHYSHFGSRQQSDLLMKEEQLAWQWAQGLKHVSKTNQNDFTTQQSHICKQGNYIISNQNRVGKKIPSLLRSSEATTQSKYAQQGFHVPGRISDKTLPRSASNLGVETTQPFFRTTCTSTQDNEEAVALPQGEIIALCKPSTRTKVDMFPPIGASEMTAGRQKICPAQYSTEAGVPDKPCPNESARLDKEVHAFQRTNVTMKAEINHLSFGHPKICIQPAAKNIMCGQVSISQLSSSYSDVDVQMPSYSRYVVRA